jgi:hypothetical protein
MTDATRERFLRAAVRRQEEIRQVDAHRASALSHLRDLFEGEDVDYQDLFAAIGEVLRSQGVIA